MRFSEVTQDQGRYGSDFRNLQSEDFREESDYLAIMQDLRIEAIALVESFVLEVYGRSALDKLGLSVSPVKIVKILGVELFLADRDSFAFQAFSAVDKAFNSDSGQLTDEPSDE
jgi:hypothetical protein